MENKRSLSNYASPTYTKNHFYFDDYLAKHRDHQSGAFITCLDKTIGQVISPCGTGKTIIQISIHIEKMIQLDLLNQQGVFVIASHRLSLNRQLLGELVDVAVRCGLPFNILYIGSQRCDFNRFYTEYRQLGYTRTISEHLATTDTKKIQAFIQSSRANNRNVIVVSTYDSFVALANVGEIEVVTFDEAHNLIQRDFKKNVLAVKPNLKSEYYFTATRKIAGDDGGMNDKTFFGEILIDICPKLMLAKSEIVCPKLHVIDGVEEQTTNTSNTSMLIKNTIEAFLMHRRLVKKYSAKPNEVGAKLLIGCTSIEEMERTYRDPSFKAFILDMPVFAISSDGAYYNHTKISKDEFFVQLNALPDSEDAIIFNVDMLTEGIDLPSITGVMPLRNLGLVKLIQLLGRALRLHKLDRKNLYANELQACDYPNYVKPYGHLIIPRHLASVDENEMMIKTVKMCYDEYGTKAEDVVIQEKFIDIQPITLNSMIPFNFRGGKDYDLEHTEMSLIQEVNLAQFKQDMKPLGNYDKEQYIKEMLK